MVATLEFPVRIGDAGQSGVRHALGPSDIVQLPSTSCVQFACWHNMLIGTGIEPETAECFDLLEDNLVELLQRYHRGVAVLYVVLHDKSPPDIWHARISALFRGYRENLLGVAGVLNAEGFGAAVQRSFATAMITATGVGDLLKLFQTREANTAVSWLCERAATGSVLAGDPEGLWAALGALEASQAVSGVAALK